MHFIAAFQVLIYVGAVMVFMVYVIMLLDPRDSAVRRRFSGLLVPGRAGLRTFHLSHSRAWSGTGRRSEALGAAARASRSKQFSAEFLNEYWLEFELTSVLLLAAIVAAICVVQVSRRASMDKVQMLLGLSVALFAIGLTGVIIRRNVLVMLMCMELMLNGVILSLVTFSYQLGTAVGAVLVFLIFVVATAEIAIAIPIVLLLVRRKRTLDLDAYADLKG